MTTVYNIINWIKIPAFSLENGNFIFVQIFCCGGRLSIGFQFKHRVLPELHCCSDCVCVAILTHKQKTRILTLRSNGKGPSEIVQVLSEDGLKINCWSVIRFLKRYQERQTLENAPK